MQPCRMIVPAMTLEVNALCCNLFLANDKGGERALRFGRILDREHHAKAFGLLVAVRRSHLDRRAQELLAGKSWIGPKSRRGIAMPLCRRTRTDPARRLHYRLSCLSRGLIRNSVPMRPPRRASSVKAEVDNMSRSGLVSDNVTRQGRRSVPPPSS